MANFGFKMARSRLQRANLSFQIGDFRLEMADFGFKMTDFHFKMVYFSFKMVDFSFKMVDFSFKRSISKDFGQNPSRLQGGTLTQKRPWKTKNDLKQCFLRVDLWLPGAELYLGGFRVLTFLIEGCCGHQGLYERGCTPPIGAKPCSCTCRARP